VLAGHASWAIRALAAGALGRLGAAGGNGGTEAARRLTEAGTTDTYALVRQAALEALASFDACSARALADRIAAGDPEPRVRTVATAIAQSVRARGACVSH
jgi:HEAT repeat protein